MPQYALVVRWSEPEDGICVYEPHEDEDLAKLDWDIVRPDFLNEGELGDDVIWEVVRLQTATR